MRSWRNRQPPEFAGQEEEMNIQIGGVELDLSVLGSPSAGARKFETATYPVSVRRCDPPCGYTLLSSGVRRSEIALPRAPLVPGLATAAFLLIFVALVTLQAGLSPFSFI